MTKSYLGVQKRRWGTWVAEIIDRETHTRRLLGSFHTAELAAMEYDRWQVRYHDAVARLNFPFGTRPVHLVPPEPGVTTRENPSSSAGIFPISSAGRRATDKALQLTCSSSACRPMLLLYMASSSAL